MKSVTIRIYTENAAFDPSPQGETWRILHALTVDNIHNGKSLRDYNGNIVGKITTRQ